MITIGIIAKSFQVLPSQVLSSGSSFDIMIMDVLTTWEEFRKNPINANFSTDNLQDIIKKARQ